MSKKGNILLQAIVFVALFFLGGIISVFALPSFTGRFFICGLIFAAVGVGVGNVVLHIGGK
jgi:hypothetical protein